MITYNEYLTARMYSKLETPTDYQKRKVIQLYAQVNGYKIEFSRINNLTVYEHAKQFFMQDTGNSLQLHEHQAGTGNWPEDLQKLLGC